MFLFFFLFIVGGFVSLKAIRIPQHNSWGKARCIVAISLLCLRLRSFDIATPVATMFLGP